LPLLKFQPSYIQTRTATSFSTLQTQYSRRGRIAVCGLPETVQWTDDKFKCRRM